MRKYLISREGVLNSLYSYLKNEIKFSATTLIKHRDNWEAVYKFAQEQKIQ